ncbi:uncharacterized protein FOBCDRAFT_296095 [Fusarium oxysporum Fo47]|uniref:uncharacterized protein n=1 Tax=Fusarium oxysporum Fo47 TaxID=660027 RepID=UPI002869BFF0|nr:uncharacterized protein FOBCDRAFT_296095 [Fusarium oxysporum Fo47]WJG35797.1 hypothetical protein FOBCDRAFT_296095 [Fusarium oxysporum Fo47]
MSTCINGERRTPFPSSDTCPIRSQPYGSFKYIVLDVKAVHPAYHRHNGALLSRGHPEKNPRRPERCSVDETIASFHDLQWSQPDKLWKTGCVPGSSRGCKEEEVLWVVHDCRDRSSSFRAAKRATNHVGSVRQGRGHQRAQKVEQLRAAGVVRAAKAVVVGRGSAKLQAKVKDAANVVWAAEAAEVDRTGIEVRRAQNVAGSRSRKSRGKKKPQIPQMK